MVTECRIGSSGFCVEPPVLAWAWQELERTSPDELGLTELLPDRNAETDRVYKGMSEGCRQAEAGGVCSERSERDGYWLHPEAHPGYRSPTQDPEEPLTLFG